MIWLKVIVKTIQLYSFSYNIGLLFIPIFSVVLNKIFSNLLDTDKTKREFWTCIFVKCLSDVFSILFQQEFLWNSTREMKKTILHRLEQANIQCGIPLPGKLLTNINDIYEDNYKLHDFLVIIPIIWTTVISFILTILYMEVHVVYHMRSIIIITIITLLHYMIKNVDQTLYERTKPCPNSIVKFSDKMYVLFKLSLGCVMKIDHEQHKQNRMNHQHRIQRIVMIIMNVIVTVIGLINNDIKFIHSFCSISWLLSCLASNIKSLQYYMYMDNLFSTLELLQKHKLKCGNEKQQLENINSVSFKNASFGYYSDISLNFMDIKIRDLSIVFHKGSIYYLEAPNGMGKSTILKMFTSNLTTGDVFYGNINRIDLTFENQRQSIIHYVQSSEYTPNLTKNEMNVYRNVNIELEKAFDLDKLWDKGMSELSGGMKKRLMVFLALISPAPIVLLDETLAELSSQYIPELGHNDGWLGKIIDILVNSLESKNKIIIIVGHDLDHRMPKEVIRLNLELFDEKTILNSIDI